MTLDELKAKCDKAEEWKRMVNSPVEDAEIVVRIQRDKVTGDRVRVARGLTGQVLTWGSKRSPTDVLLKVRDVRKFIARCEKELVAQKVGNADKVTGESK